jgi:hypothetical protein
MSTRARSIFAVLALMFFVAVGSSRGEERALSVDQVQVVDAVKGVFAAAALDDLAKFHAEVAPGFYLYDAGARFDGDAIMALIKAEHAKGRRYGWNVTEPDVHIIGDTAWIAYVNKGAVTNESGTKAQTWLESAFLERRGGFGRLCSCTVLACLRLRRLPLCRCGRWSRFGGVVEAGGAEGVAGPGGVGESGGFHELEHAWGAREAFDRGGQVAVGGGFAGDEAA